MSAETADNAEMFTLFQVRSYMERSITNNLLKTATYTWPNFIPSPYLTPLLSSEVSLVSAEKNRAKVLLLRYSISSFK